MTRSKSGPCRTMPYRVIQGAWTPEGWAEWESLRKVVEAAKKRRKGLWYASHPEARKVSVRD